MNLKEKLRNYYMRRDENKILKKNFIFDSFDYDFNTNIPVFYIASEYDIKLNKEFICAFTPRLLKYCVEHLTHYAKIDEAMDIECFKGKCKVNKEMAICESAEWDQICEDLTKYLQEYAQNHAAEVEKE